MKKILLPTDFSKNSINAIEYAIKLFENTTCEFYLLNVQKASSFISDDMMTVTSTATIYNTLIDAAKKSIVNIISQIKNQFQNKNHTFHSIVDYDNFIDSINQACENNEVDLIIMGTKGASGLDKVLFGSNTVRVIQRCKTPVLAIPSECTFEAIGSIAFTSSFSSTYIIDNLKHLQHVIFLHQYKLKVLNVIGENDYEEELAENIDFFQAHFNNVEYERIVPNDKDIYESIHHFLISNNIRMLAMLGKRHSFLERLFTTHTVEQFAFKINIPLLVMQYK